MPSIIRVEPCGSIEQPGWLDMRQSLWPQSTREQHLADMRNLLSSPRRYGQFVAYSSHGEPIGFTEVSLRSDYVNGTESSPVGFLEGIYAVPEFRRQGVARALLTEVVCWVRAAGASELASDTLLENELSQEVHRALGFVETERVVYFRKVLE
jgi:aminoglycoside 6'-N-acetyltransferase I